jgi:hypothetical protein
MFGLGIIEVGIGMAFVFLAVSLVCSTVREFVETISKTRAMDLERGLRELLADYDGKGFTRTLFDHPLIAGLFPGKYDPGRLRTTSMSGGDVRMPLSGRRSLPSYVPAGQFATALLDVVLRGSAGSPYPAPPLSIDSLRASAAVLDNEQVRRAVLSAIDFGGGDLEKVKANVEAWFNGTMDRVSGWYKRRTQLILFGIGLGVAVVLNVDAITIAERLGSDAALRSAVVASAEKTVREGAPRPDASAEVDGTRQALERVGLPIGWVAGWPAPQFGRPCDPEKCSDFAFSVALQMTLGWLLTAVAVMLGAPFWFDVLNKLMVIRSTVKPREKSQEEGSEDRPSSVAPARGPSSVVPGAVPAPAGTALPPAAPTPAGYEPNQWKTAGKDEEGIL